MKGAADKPGQALKCASAGREITRDELVLAHSENIARQTKEMTGEAATGILQGLKDSLEKTFAGGTHIRTQ